VCEYCAKSELHPAAAGLEVLKGFSSPDCRQHDQEDVRIFVPRPENCRCGSATGGTQMRSGKDRKGPGYSAPERTQIRKHLS
jgi:hypothetical protein